MPLHNNLPVVVDQSILTKFLNMFSYNINKVTVDKQPLCSIGNKQLGASVDLAAKSFNGTVVSPNAVLSHLTELEPDRPAQTEY